MDKPAAAFFGKGGNAVSSRSSPLLKEDAVWINSTQGFKPVPLETWEFRIGDRQICRDWLASRRGRALTAEDRKTFCRILESLDRTRKIMTDIDAAIDRHGGWPIQ